MIPPWVRPESPETIRLIDDATVAFQPSFGRGQTQRGIFADPRWGLRRRYRGLRSDEKAAILVALSETRGQFNVLRVTPHAALRGSFPSTELFTNGTFGNGTTGLSGLSGSTSISVSDRVARVARTAYNSGSGTFIYNTSGISLTQYASYVARAMVRGGRNSTGALVAAGTTAGSATNGSFTSSTSLGLMTAPFVAQSASGYFIGAGDLGGAGYLAGDTLFVQMLSLSRCPLIDNGANMLTFSNALTNGAWSALAAVLSDSIAGAPDGNSTASKILETAVNSGHWAVHSNTAISSAAADYCLAGAFQSFSGNRWVALDLEEQTGSTGLIAYFDLVNGVTGTVTSGANWSGGRSFMVSLGGGWYYCAVVGRKTNSATNLKAYLQVAQADNVGSYLGAGGGILSWNVTLAQSSFPVRLVPSTTAIAATAQTGAALYIKALPVSTDGLLEIGDWFEVGGELKQVTARLNSDAAGLGYLQFRPALATSPSDNDAVIINTPLGRFIYPGTREFENLFGIYGDCEMNLEEIYS